MLSKAPYIVVGAIAVFTILILFLAPPAYNSGGNVCERTQQVRDAIASATGEPDCTQTTSGDLLEIIELDLSDSGISSLNARDFVGLHRLRTLDLSGNSIETLPAGVFDELFLLETLRLDGNSLATVPVNVFEELFLLEELNLDGNEFSSLPDGLFDELSRFDGMQPNGDAPDNSGQHPRIQRFLDRHGITSPEQFINALPPLYKERFGMIYESGSPAEAHVSGDHPRIVSWGADGSFIFAWNTDPGAPDQFLQSVEFLRQNDDDWTAGVIDFTGESPSIKQPVSCQVCHGSLSKPLWGQWNRWHGTEADRAGNETADADMQAIMESTAPRIQPLDFSMSSFLSGLHSERFIKTPGRENYVMALAEAGAVWSWRHGEVLHTRLKARQRDYRSFAENQMCMASATAQYVVPREFDMRDHNLFVPANIDRSQIDYHPGLLKGADALIRYAYYYHTEGSVSDVVNFLIPFDLWRQEPMVRKLYRDTSNIDMLPSKYRSSPAGILYYQAGSATAEDELIQKYRIHFGRGGAAFLVARAIQNERRYWASIPSAQFWDAHVEPMRDSVCEALTGSKPQYLVASLSGGNAVLQWDAPTHDTVSLTGYRILRGGNSASLDVQVADTQTTDTTWTDRNPTSDESVYSVQAVYGDYMSPQSNRATTTASLVPSTVRNLSASPYDFKVALNWEAPEGDATVTGYRIMRGTDGGPLRTLISDTGSVATKYTDGALMTAEAYTYGVAALNGQISGPGTTASVDAIGHPSPDSTLWALVLTGIEFAFDPATIEYTVDVENGLSETTVTPATSHSEATYSIKLGGVTDEDGVLTLAVGENVITVEVAAQYGPVYSTYTVRINRAEAQEEQQAANTPATGQPTVNGTVQVGETLTVSTSGIADADGLENATFHYQWITRDGATETDIPGATGSTHTLTDAEARKNVKVKVSFTDDAGNPEEVISAETYVLPPPLTAEIQNAPASHNGEDAFFVRVAFNQDIIIGWEDVRGHSFTVASGEVTGARRVEGRRDLWEITVEPEDDDDVTVSLPEGRSCDVPGAPCNSDGMPLTNQPEVTVSGPVEETDPVPEQTTQSLPDRPYELTAAVSDGAVVLIWKPPVGQSYMFDYQIHAQPPRAWRGRAPGVRHIHRDG